MKYPYPVVQVVWLDASTDIGWEDAGESNTEAPEVMTVGFQLHKDEKTIVVASTSCKERMTNARITIPVGMVKSIKQLKRAGAER